MGKKRKGLVKKEGSYLSEPISYDIEVVQDICTEIALGGNVNEVLAKDGYPDKNTYYKWLNQYPDAQQLHDKALEIKMHGFIEETVSIADGLKPRVVEYRDDDGNVIRKTVSPDDKEVKRDSLRISARQWAASKLAGRIYGDKKTVDMNMNGEIKHSLHNLIAGEETVIDVKAEEVEDADYEEVSEKDNG